MRWRKLGFRRRHEVRGRKRVLLLVPAVIQIALLVAALRDLRVRPSEQIRGPRVVWVLVSFVNFIGPISYFVFGRRR